MESVLIEITTEEKELFALLRFLFWTEPSRQLLNNLLELPIEEGEESTDIERGLRMIHLAVRQNRDRLDAYQEELAVEFARLFIGPDRPVAVPYASFYLSETRIVMTEEVTIAIRKLYLEAGLSMQNLYSIPDDHIAAELEFLAWSADQTIKCYEEGDKPGASRHHERLNTFLCEHLALWVPEFCKLIIQGSNEEFYQGAALTLKSVLSEYA